MISIKLSPSGKPNKPFFRIVVQESGKERSGGSIEVLGYWQPKVGQKKIDQARFKYWIDKGAKPTKSVLKLL